MFRRTSICHQDFTTPPPPPCASEGQKATVVAPLSSSYPQPPARTRGSRRRHTASDRIEALPPGDRPSGLLPGGRIRGWQGVDSVGRPSRVWSSGEGKKDSCPAFFAGFLTQQVAVLKKSQSQPGFDLVRVDSDARGIFAVS